MLETKRLILRKGTEDDADSLKAFKKAEGCTPSQYRRDFYEE